MNIKTFKQHYLFRTMEEPGHIQDILKKAIVSLKARDMMTLRGLSNQTVHTSSIYQDPDSIGLAVTIYALSKIVERENYRHYSDWRPFLQYCIKCMTSAIEAIKENDIEEFRNNLIKIRESIQNMSSKLKEYIFEVFRKAAISKASRIYEHGISRAETARLLGISQWELAEYVGRTGIADIDISITKSIQDRIKLAEKIFK
jgi:hypothetical protein